MSNQKEATIGVMPKVIEINHAVSGIFGQNLQKHGILIEKTRRQIMKKLEKKKKHSNVLKNQIYDYMQKFQKEEINIDEEQVLSSKKNHQSLYDEKPNFKTPFINFKLQIIHQTKEAEFRIQRLGDFLKNTNIDIDKLLEK